MNIFDVLIVGAGPVGLATAIGLRQRGINNILVIEQTSSFQRVGQIVDILPNGLQALKCIDKVAYQQVKETSLTWVQTQQQDNQVNQKKFWHQKNLKGEIIRSLPLDFATWFELYGEGRVSISWFDLQTTLRNLLPPEIVKANHRCVNFTQDNDSVEVTCVCNQKNTENIFAHWEMSTLGQTKTEITDTSNSQKTVTKKFRAKLVVAADGINSTIRQLLYHNSDLSPWAKPQYSGIGAIGCLKIDLVPQDITQELETKYLQEGRIITIRDDSQQLDKPWIILLHRQKNTFGYLLHTPINLNLLQNKSSEEMIKLAVAILAQADFPSSITKLVALSNPEGLFHRPYYIHPANIPVDSQAIWSNGRLVLVGDSAHGMPPFMAQGANQGLEDAALITTLITNLIHQNALDDADKISCEFLQYEQIRRPFMIKIQSATMENHGWTEKQWANYHNMVFSRNLQQFISDLSQ